MIPCARPSAEPVEAGFSLVEVMVAVLILGIGLVGMTQGITTALGSSKDGEDYSQAVILAANRIELVRADGDFVDGQIEGTAGVFTWRQTISSVTPEGLHQVKVDVLRSEGREPVYSLSTLLYEPPSEAADAGAPRRADAGQSKRKRGGKSR